MDQLNNLSPQQRQAVMQQAAMQANQQIMQDMMQRSVAACFKKCAGSSVSLLCIAVWEVRVKCFVSVDGLAGESHSYPLFFFLFCLDPFSQFENRPLLLYYE